MPFLTKDAQKYITCFEALAQLALAHCIHAKWRCQHLAIKAFTGSDNTGAEAGINKLFTTSFPLRKFVKLIATWAYRHNVQLSVSDIAGLNRGNLSRFANRTACRKRFSPHLLATGHEIQLHPPDRPCSRSPLLQPGAHLSGPCAYSVQDKLQRTCRCTRSTPFLCCHRAARG